MKTYKQFILEKFELRESNVGDPTMIRKKRLIEYEDELDEETLDELSKKTIGSYIGKALTQATDMDKRAKQAKDDAEYVRAFERSRKNPPKKGKIHTLPPAEFSDDIEKRASRKRDKRLAGIHAASRQLTKEDIDLDEALEDNTLYIKKHDDGVNIKHKSHSISLNNDHINHLTSMDAGSHIKHGDWNIKKMKSSYVFTHPSGSRIKLHKNEVED